MISSLRPRQVVRNAPEGVCPKYVHAFLFRGRVLNDGVAQCSILQGERLYASIYDRWTRGVVSMRLDVVLYYFPRHSYS